MSLARLALQVGLIFCVMGAAVGLGAELSVDTIIWRSLLCALAGAGLGAGLGALVRWLHGLSQDGTVLGADADPLPAETSMMGEEHGIGG